MLNTSADLIRVVSGSDVAWRRPAGDIPAPYLLRDSALWLFADPQTLLATGRTPLAELGSTERLSLLAQLGFSGLYLAPLEASGREWRPERSAQTPDQDITSFELSKTVGTEQELRKLAEQANAHKLLLGTAILPAFTGWGPDFFLALRAVRDWPGAYVMLEIPPAEWPLLPNGPALLPDALCEQFIARKILPALPVTKSAAPLEPLPAPLLSAALPAPHGPLPASLSSATNSTVAWAVSDAVSGQDGRTRRWAYLCAGSLERPLLNWEDPSASARRMLSGSVIRQVGLRQIPLVGLRMKPLFGLTPAGQKHRSDQRDRLEPGLSALRDLTREIHRYGGWSLLLDRVDPALTPHILESGCDLLADNVTSPAGEYALLSGDAAPLRAALDTAITQKLDQRRFLRSPGSPQDMGFSVPSTNALSGTNTTPEEARAHPYLGRPSQSLPGGHHAPQTPSVQGAPGKTVLSEKAPQSGQGLYASTPALAAARLGLNAHSASQSDTLAIKTLHEALLLFRAGLPGVLCLSGHDLAGVTHAPFPPSSDEAPLPDEATLPAWGLGPGMPSSTAGGVPRGVAVYAPVSAQLGVQDSFAAAVKLAAAVRRQTGVAGGVLLERLPTEQPGSVAVLVRMPDGGLLLTAVNFSDTVVNESFVLPAQARDQLPRLARDLLRQTDIEPGMDRLKLKLPPLTCRMLLFPVQPERASYSVK